MRLTIKLAALILTGSLIFCPNVLADVEDNLVAHYLFDNSANDETDFENHGESKGSGKFKTDRYGRENFAFEFNQDSIDIYSFIDLKNDNSLRELDTANGVTIAAWVRLDTNEKTQTIFTNNGVKDFGYFMRIAPSGQPETNGHLVFGFGDGTQTKTVISNKVLNTGEWYHVMGVLRSPNSDPLMALYINGERDTNSTIEGSAPNVEYDTAETEGYIGTVGIDNPTAKTDYFDGMMDDVRFYDIARDVVDAETLYNGEIVLNLPESVTEDDEPLRDAGKISIYKAAGASGLTFTLTSSDEKKIKGTTVTISSGNKEATFDIILVDNDEVDEDKEVTLTVKRNRYITATKTVNVRDDETMGCFITTLLN